MSVNYWFGRMKHGVGGPDFARKLWNRNRIGIVYGGWRLEDVMTDGRPDLAKIESLPESQRPGTIMFDTRWVSSIRMFFSDAKPGDRVLVFFDKAIHVATIGADYCEDEDALKIDDMRSGQEWVKCRSIQDKRSFLLEKLPPSFRLIRLTGRQAFQAIRACSALAQTLDRSNSEAAVWSERKRLAAAELLSHLSPEEWEMVCCEYLRDKTKFYPTIPIGRTLADIDIVGLTPQGRVVVGQCKNSERQTNAVEVMQWIENAGVGEQDDAYWFVRGGSAEVAPDHRYTIVSGKDIESWLNGKPEYLKILRGTFTEGT